MKKIYFKSLLFGAISVLAVACNSANSSSEKSSDKTDVTASSHGLKIMYINADTLLANYQYVVDVKKAAENEHNQLQSLYDEKAQSLQSDYQAYQEKVSKGLISQNDAKKVESNLMSRKQELDGLQAKMSAIMDSVQKKNADIQQKVTAFLTQLEKEKHYDYVLTYTSNGGSVLYANSNLDITKEVIAGLNEDYNKSATKK